MNEIQNKINDAYKLISSILVSGDAVDVMAGARVVLKDAYQLAGDKSALWEAHKLAEKGEKKTDG